MAQTALRRGSQEEGNSDYFTGCPIGGGFIWYGLPTKIPSNCRICENQTMAISSFAKLYENMGNSWGQSGSNFSLPDFRGRFPRGVANGSANDPDRATRAAANPGGNSGDAVGSVQGEDYKAHNHPTRIVSFSGAAGTEQAIAKTNTGTVNYTFGADAPTYPQIGNTGGNETRPKNANVYFVIRVE